MPTVVPIHIYTHTHPSPISSNKLMTIRTVYRRSGVLDVQSKVMPGLRTFLLYRDDYLSVRFSPCIRQDGGRLESPLVSIVEGDPPAQCIQEYLGLEEAHVNGGCKVGRVKQLSHELYALSFPSLVRYTLSPLTHRTRKFIPDNLGQQP